MNKKPNYLYRQATSHYPTSHGAFDLLQLRVHIIRQFERQVRVARQVVTEHDAGEVRAAGRGKVTGAYRWLGAMEVRDLVLRRHAGYSTYSIPHDPTPTPPYFERSVPMRVLAGCMEVAWGPYGGVTRAQVVRRSIFLTEVRLTGGRGGYRRAEEGVVGMCGDGMNEEGIRADG
jgi:hypothetical protein